MPLLEVKIPPMGESINSGVLANWHVKDGDVVKKDQPLFELETDKITSEGTAEAAGKISLKAAAGAELMGPGHPHRPVSDFGKRINPLKPGMSGSSVLGGATSRPRPGRSDLQVCPVHR